MYSIGEIASLLNLTTSTLRYYDKEGLLPNVQRSQGGIRVFSESDLELLRVVDCLKKSGLQIKDIKAFVAMITQGDETIDERLKLFEARRDEISRQINELNETLEILNYKCWYYQTAKKLGSTESVENLCDSDLPNEILRAKEKLQNR